VFLGATEPFQQRQSVKSGQHEIQDDDIVIVGFCQPKPFATVAAAIDRTASFAQSAGKRQAQPLGIFNQQEFHAGCIVRSL